MSAWVDAGGVGVGGTGRRCLDRVVTPVGARGKGWPRGAVGPPEEGAAACRGEGAEEGRRRRGRRRTESPKTARMGAATGCFALPVCVLVVESVESCAQSAACTWPGLSRLLEGRMNPSRLAQPRLDRLVSSRRSLARDKRLSGWRPQRWMPTCASLSLLSRFPRRRSSPLLLPSPPLLPRVLETVPHARRPRTRRHCAPQRALRSRWRRRAGQCPRREQPLWVGRRRPARLR